MSIENTKGKSLQFDLFDAEIPEGFTIASKNDIKEGNICNHCDARKLCQLNKNEWCKKYPCMAYRRQDGKSVYFKKH
jgi:hypothetical protein